MDITNQMGIYTPKICSKEAIFDAAFGLEYYVEFHSREIIKRVPGRFFGFNDENTGCMLSEDLSTVFANKKYENEAIVYARARELLGRDSKVIIEGRLVYPSAGESKNE